MIGAARARLTPSGPANALGTALVASVPDESRSREEVIRRRLAAASGETKTVETNHDDRPEPWAPFNPMIAPPPDRPSCR